MQYDALTGKRSFVFVPEDMYSSSPDNKIVGFFSFGTPTLVVNDIDLVKAVLIKDFDHFTDRRHMLMDPGNKMNDYFNKVGAESTDVRRSLH